MPPLRTLHALALLHTVLFKIFDHDPIHQFTEFLVFTLQQQLQQRNKIQLVKPLKNLIF